MYIKVYPTLSTLLQIHDPKDQELQNSLLPLRSKMSSSTTTSPIYDVLIIGAGPSGLAVASRLREPTPSTLYTDAEHSQYRRATTSHQGPKKGNGDRKQGRDLSLLVLDGTAPTWMGRWKHAFRVQDIEYLRSPVFFHVDPGDRDALLAHCFERGRNAELREIQGCVGAKLKGARGKKAAR